MSLSTKVLFGLGAGILAGIFFGEHAAFLKVFGDAFVLLLQMTVLPYIMASLIAGLGGISRHSGLSGQQVRRAASGAVGTRVGHGSGDAAGFPGVGKRLLFQHQFD